MPSCPIVWWDSLVHLDEDYAWTSLAKDFMGTYGHILFIGFHPQPFIPIYKLVIVKLNWFPTWVSHYT